MKEVKLKHIGKLLILLIGMLLIAIVFTIPVIKQDLDYHKFTDSKTLFGISNFWNVVSNIPFLIVGVLGLLRLKVFSKNRRQYLMLFLGILLISIGSGYYHFNPNNETLIWDRLPMTITFMALLSILISEFINKKIGKKLLLPLLFLGMASIILWVIKDDLRLYVLVQFFPIFTIPIILVFFKTKHNFVKGYWFLLICYLIAKALEYYDNYVHSLIYFSGHTLKHIVSAIGLYCLFKHYKKTFLQSKF